MPGEVGEQVRARRGGVVTALDATLAHNPALLDAWNGFLGTVRGGLTIGADVVETVALRVAVLNGAAYEWAAHLPPARAAGLDEGVIESLRTEGPVGLGGAVGPVGLGGAEGPVGLRAADVAVGLPTADGPVGLPAADGPVRLGEDGGPVDLREGGSVRLGEDGGPVDLREGGSVRLGEDGGSVDPPEDSPVELREGPVPGAAARLRVVVAVTDELTRTAGLTDATAALAAREFPEPQLVELFAVVSCYNMVSRFLNAAGLAPEDRVVEAGRP
ncbi:carboxymuconolactone decarboxylase family protein [Streptomyces sp. NPDC004610]|uniref:carboxymuconolactone decarboxylase family protein n=1 Tax=unclassified Streptomyces TaxID=2593676 RepID=UPI0033A49D97